MVLPPLKQQGADSAERPAILALESSSVYFVPVGTLLSLRKLARSCKYRLVCGLTVRASVSTVKMAWMSYSFLTVSAMKHVGNSRDCMNCTSYEGCRECQDIRLG